MKIGFAAVPITPALGTPLGGYARLRYAASIDSDLYARAMYISNDGVEIGIITFDLLGVDAEFVAKVRNLVFERTGMPADAVMVTATHTHSSPAELPQAPWRSREKPMTQFREHAINIGATSLELAKHKAQGARLWRGRASVGDLVASNRRREDGPFDPTVTALVARSETDEGERMPIGTLIHFACHPTITGEQGTEISAEYPGWAIWTLLKSVGGSAMFVNGAAGDISTRFRRREQTPREAKRLGTIVGGAAVMAVANAVPLDNLNIGCKRILCNPAVGNPLSACELAAQVAEAEKLLRDLYSQNASHGQIRIAQTNLEGLQIAERLKRDLQTTSTVLTEVQALSVGDLVLLGLPGEPFIEYGRILQGPEKSVILLGYANDYVGYLPTLESFIEGGYEAVSAVLSHEGIEELLRTAKNLLQQT